MFPRYLRTQEKYELGSVTLHTFTKNKYTFTPEIYEFNTNLSYP